jgi:undecaprenyl-diphosphatase
LHLGTLLAVFVYFWRDLLGMALALPRALTQPRRLLRDPDPLHKYEEMPGDPEARLALLIAVATIPALLTGIFGQSTINDFFHSEVHRKRAIAVIAVLMALLALLLWAADKAAAHQRGVHHLTWRDAVTIGLAQATALLPGVSRSGATITAGLFHGLNRVEAARFSFLLGVPIIAGAGAKGLIDTLQTGLSGSEAQAFAAGMIASAVTGFIAIWGLLRYLQRASTAVFVIYRLCLSLTLLILLAVGFR